MTGNPYVGLDPHARDPRQARSSIRSGAQRADEKAQAAGTGVLVGTGVACVTKDYGTGADCSLGAVEIEPDGPHRDPRAMRSRWATASAPRWPIAWRAISAASPTR